MKNKQFVDFCDKAMALSFYALIFFLPISIALCEIFTVLALLFYIFKRSAVFFISLKEIKTHSTFITRINAFLSAYKPIANPLNRPIIAFMSICILSILFSQYPRLGIMGFLGKILQGVFIYFNFIECMMTKKRMKIFVTILIVSSAVVGINGLYQYQNSSGFIHQRFLSDGRITSSFRASNDFGTYLVFIAPVLLSLFAFARKKNQNDAQGDFLLSNNGRWLLSIIFVISLIALGLTYSRGALLAFFCSLIILGLCEKKFLRIFLLSGTLFIVIFVLMMVYERSYFDILTVFEPTGREFYWQEALQIIKQYPLLGTGLNTYSQIAKDYKIVWGGYAHNCYLQMAAEIGLIGLASFLWMQFELFKSSIIGLKSLKDDFLRLVLYGSLAGLSGFLIHSAFDTAFYSVQLGSLMWIAMGMLFAVTNISSNEGSLD